jgi:hypothetical protein
VGLPDVTVAQSVVRALRPKIGQQIGKIRREIQNLQISLLQTISLLFFNKYSYVFGSNLHSSQVCRDKLLLGTGHVRNNPRLHIRFHELHILVLSNHQHNGICHLHRLHGHYKVGGKYLQ